LTASSIVLSTSWKIKFRCPCEMTKTVYALTTSAKYFNIHVVKWKIYRGKYKKLHTAVE
jgi:hypothetical protein